MQKIILIKEKKFLNLQERLCGIVGECQTSTQGVGGSNPGADSAEK